MIMKMIVGGIIIGFLIVMALKFAELFRREAREVKEGNVEDEDE